jgi:hypothetical protein
MVPPEVNTAVVRPAPWVADDVLEHAAHAAGILIPALDRRLVALGRYPEIEHGLDHLLEALARIQSLLHQRLISGRDSSTRGNRCSRCSSLRTSSSRASSIIGTGDDCACSASSAVSRCRRSLPQYTASKRTPYAPGVRRSAGPAVAQLRELVVVVGTKGRLTVTNEIDTGHQAAPRTVRTLPAESAACADRDRTIPRSHCGSAPAATARSSPRRDPSDARQRPCARAGCPEKNRRNSSGKISLGPTEYQGWLAISSISLRGSGILRKLQSISGTISS